MRPLVLAAGIAAVALWGASPAATKVAVAELEPFDVALLRTGLGGLLALPLALALRLPLPDTPRHWGLVAVSASTGFVLFPIVFSIGQALTSASHAVLILSLMPVMTGAYVALTSRRWPAARWWLGSLIALGGTALLTLATSGGDPAAGGITGDLLVLGSTAFASLGYVAGGRLAQDGYPSAAATFWGAVLAAALLLPLAWHRGAIDTLASSPVHVQLAIVYLAAVVTIIAYVLWYWALAEGGISRVATLQFLQPITGLVLAVLLLGETPAWLSLLAALIIISGVTIARR